MQGNTYLWIYLIPLLVVVGWHVWRRRQAQARVDRALAEAEASGANEPVSLHPVVNPTRCISSGACARACPEKALGVVDGHPVLVNAAACIGHGACAAACPTQALALVFGTERRGVDIPEVGPDFQTNVPGVYIAGELGGMGLIRKAVEQGRQATAALAAQAAKAAPADLDVVIVGAGPAGLSAGLAALHRKLRYVVVEQEDSLGGSIYHYPRNKIAMTAPAQLEGVGPMRLGTEVRKEKLLEFWNGVVQRTGLALRFGERFVGAERRADGTFTVRTSRAEYHGRTLLLALGRRGTPRKLGVPGEDLPKVVYRLVDAEQYRGRQVLVVGGGDSAIEAAVAVAEQPGTTVALSYRGEAFNRIKPANRERLRRSQEAGRIEVLLGSEVDHIDADAVHLRSSTRGELRRANDAVIVCAGGELPTALLQTLGVRFETKRGTA